MNFYLQMQASDLEDISPLLEAIISFIDEGVIIFDDQGNILYQNPSAQKLLGSSNSKKITSLKDIEGFDLFTVLNKKLAKVTPPKSVEEMNEHFARFSQDVVVNGVCRFLEFNSCHACDQQGSIRLLIIKDKTDTAKLDTLLNRSQVDLITKDPAMLQLISRIEQVAPNDASVLLQGESGTGKTHIARLIHRLSRRADKPFVEVNCAAIPESLIESELFGHVKGAFTGATQNRKGRFLAADGGTLFLDEVGEIPMYLQAKLLRVIQDQEFEAVGSDKTQKVDVRIISSSNRPLRELAEAGDFRADLYYRLAVIPLHVPAVRERRGDIPLLIDHFRNKLKNKGYNTDTICSPEAMQLMLEYPWPGNVRELENAVEHALICAIDGKVLPESLPQDIQRYKQNPATVRPPTPPSPLAAPPQTTGTATAAALEQERRRIEDALKRARGNKSLAAKYLNIDRTTLWRRMRKLGM